MFYSYNGAYPAALPKSHLDSAGNNYTSMHELPEARLNSLGFTAVAPPPSYDMMYEELTWDGSSWVVTPYSDDVILDKVAFTRKNKKVAIRTLKEIKLDEGITVASLGNLKVRCNESSQGRLSRLNAKMHGGGTQKLVTDEDVAVEITKPQNDALWALFEAYVSECEAAHYDAVVALDALTTIEDISAYQVAWPTQDR